MAMRAAQLLKPGQYVNLGMGIPTNVTNYITPEFDMLLHAENGILGYGPEPSEAEYRWQYFNAQGQLVTSSGYPVVPAITVPVNATSLTIGSDGIVSITQQGSAATTPVGTLQLATFINPAGLDARGENLFAETASSGVPNVSQPGLNGVGTLNQGYVETSNVNVVQELVNMIQTQRAYEVNSKAVTTSDQMLQTLSQMPV